MALSRRQTLFGMAAAAIAPTVPVSKTLVTFGADSVNYMSRFEEDAAFLEGMSQVIVTEFFYSDELPPRRFDGLQTVYA